MTDFLIKPSVNNRSLFKLKKSINEKGEITKIPIIEEKPLTLYLNNQEIVTIMTIGDYPKYLAIGYLFNQGMLKNIEDVKKIEFHKDLKTVVVRTKNKTNYEECIKKYEQNYTTIYDNIHNKELFIIEFNNNLVTFI